MCKSSEVKGKNLADCIQEQPYICRMHSSGTLLHGWNDRDLQQSNLLTICASCSNKKGNGSIDGSVVLVAGLT